jgi:antitoxin component of RelBE/YafQ-DinJ toxin-antitoxin module
VSEASMRNIRVDDDLWTHALAMAAARGETLSEVIRRALCCYVEQGCERTACAWQEGLER